MPRLFLRVLSEATLVADEQEYEIHTEWLIRENDGSVRGFGVTDYRGLADVADPNVDWLADPDNTVVYIPSQFVLRVSCEVPGRNAAQIRRALPFAVEEFVATDIESMHIAHAPIKPGTPVVCNIITHQQIENWLACFKAIGVTPGYFVADAEVLPREPGTVSLLFEESTVLVADADQAAVIDRGNLRFALDALDVQRLVAINGVPSDLELGQLEIAPEVTQVDLSRAGVLDYLADRFTASTFINLLQGEYRAVRPQSASARKWRGIAALAAVWVGIAFIGMVAEGWWASSEADRVEAEGFAFYQEASPTESQPSGSEQLRRRMAAKLGARSDGDGSAFVGLTSHFANVVDAKNQVLSLAYAEQRRELTVEIMLDSYDDLEEIKSKLAAVGVAIDVTNAEEEGNTVRSRIRVRYAT